MNRREWLLLAIGPGLQPIQIQKLMFKFAMEAGAPARETYDFEPYNWGPCSFDIYGDLAALREAGLIEASPSGGGWDTYKVSAAGEQEAARLDSRADQQLVKALVGIRTWVVSRSFERLLLDVYRQYPQFATRSLFR